MTTYKNSITHNQAKELLTSHFQVFVKIEDIEYPVNNIKINKGTFTFGYVNAILPLTNEVKFYTKNSQTYSI